MAIKISELLQSNARLDNDATPGLGGDLDTNGFEIFNSSGPVTISGIAYPTDPGIDGQVLTTDGLGIAAWEDPASGPVTLIGDVSGTGISPVTTTLNDTDVLPGTYGSSSVVGSFIVNSQGRLTSAANSQIVINPADAGLGNLVNSLQVINAGGAPSIREGSGVPIGTDTLGAIYIDRSITNGNGIYYYNGTLWAVIATRPNLYSEKINGFVAPAALALNSVAIGSGAETASSATGSLAIGLQSLARIPGGVVQANGRFASNGDAQAGRYLLRGNTVSNVPQELFINGTGGTVRLNLPDNSTWTFRIMVTAHRTDLGDGRAGYTASGVIYRGSGAVTTSIQGSVIKAVLAESNPSWDINIGADTTNGSLKVTVTGENSKIIRWVALVETVEITN